MKTLIISLLSIFISLGSFSQQSSFYKLSAKTIDGKNYNFKKLKGKKVMIVNTATKCSLSPQFNALQELYQEYSDNDFVIIAFPANNFMNREPGDNESIKATCERRFQTTFPLMEKISVKDEDIHTVYQWLTHKDLNGVMDSDVKWNFQKFLIDENGVLIKAIDPIKKPDSEEVISWIASDDGKDRVPPRSG